MAHFESGSYLPYIKRNEKLLIKYLIYNASSKLNPGTRFEIHKSMPNLFPFCDRPYQRIAWYSCPLPSFQEAKREPVKKWILDIDRGCFVWGEDFYASKKHKRPSRKKDGIYLKRLRTAMVRPIGD